MAVTVDLGAHGPSGGVSGSSSAVAERIRPSRNCVATHLRYLVKANSAAGQALRYRLHRVSDGVLLASGDQAYDSLPNPHYVVVDIPDVAMQAGVTYSLGVFNTPDLMLGAARGAPHPAEHSHDIFAVQSQFFTGGNGAAPGFFALDEMPSSASTNDIELAVGLVVEYNLPPNSPTPLFPVGNQSINRTAPLRFRWQPNDPDVGDSQSRFDLRYRAVGAAAWTDVTAQTPNAFHDLAAGTLLAGPFEWQVRTYDAQGLPGPYSASEFGTANTPPPGPVWTAPVSGEVIGAQTYTATYAAPDQVARQTRIVADLAGAPDEASVLYGSDSGRIATALRSITFTFPVNSVNVHLQVRVENGGLWGPWATVPVQVSYTRPPVPTLTLTAGPASIVVTPTVPAPTPGQPTVAYLDLFARAATGDPYRPAAGVRIARIAPSQTYPDRAVASGVEYAYQLVAVGVNGTESPSGWVDRLDVAPAIPGTTSNTYDTAVYDTATYG